MQVSVEYQLNADSPERIYLLSKNLIHLEHVNFINIEDSPQASVAHNFTLITRVLKPIALDMIPDSFYDLRSRHFVNLKEG